jgi:NitT/TauT family transport system permease protein
MFIVITKYNLNPNIWLTPLLIVGSQWYILFNVIAGTANFPNDLKEASQSLKIDGILWWKKVMLPGIVPYYITGVITAAGGAWNASIVAEVINFGDEKMTALGLGYYIAEVTQKADFPKVVLGIGMMSIVVVGLNKFFWQPLQEYCNKKFTI